MKQKFKYTYDVIECHKNNICYVLISNDGKRVASIDDNGIVKIWDIKSKRIIASFNSGFALDDYIVTLAFSPDSSRLALGTEIGVIIVIDCKQQEVI